MLQSLHVKNLALIDETEVEFGDGLNILSGETGAGKSIIIGSINLALGNKVPKEMLRENGENAYVELVFSIDQPELASRLKELDLDIEDDYIVLSRKISSGRAVAKINGESVSASKMKDVASLLIDIHGQHEHQSLLNKSKHIHVLDNYCKSQIFDLLESYAGLYAEYRKLKEDYTNSNSDTREQEREKSLLEFEIKELEEAHLIVGEDEELEAIYQKISHSKLIMESLSNVYANTSEDSNAVTTLLGRSIREFQSIVRYDDALATFENQLMEIDNLISDFNHELSAYMEDLDFDEEEFFHLQQRLNTINHLKSRYGNTIEKILRAYEEKIERYSILCDYEGYLIKLKDELTNKEKELLRLSNEISVVRKEAAIAFQSQIMKALEELNFLNVSFEVSFHELPDFSALGRDDIEFMISTNPGEALKPLDKVASGGELSRIMLALKTIMADKDEIGSLIFDEIDSGISGRTAQMVSEKMNELGKNHQIICITHLPQIAAMADHHFLIEKNVENDRTVSSIKKLSDIESVNELARMLGGVAITDAVIENAKEMKNLAKSKK